MTSTATPIEMNNLWGQPSAKGLQQAMMDRLMNHQGAVIPICPSIPMV